MPSFIRLHDSLINLFSDYLPLPCYLWRGVELEAAWALGPIPPRTHTLYFEAEYGRVQERFAFIRARVRRAGAKPFSVAWRGQQDLFVPLGKPGTGQRHFILAGAFQRSLPTRSQLWRQWCALRRAPGPDDGQGFLAYSVAVLQTPVLEKGIETLLARLLAPAGEALLGRGDPDQAADRIEAAKRDVLGRRLPWRMWHYAEARRDRFNRGPYQGSELAPWDAQEFRLRRSPDSAVALALREPAQDPVEALRQAALLQQACFAYCRDRPGLVAGRLGGEGAFILSVGSAHAARALASDAAAAVGRRLGSRLVAVHRSRPGQPGLLDLSIQEAEAGLRLALVRGSEVMEAEPMDEAAPLVGRLEGLSLELARALAAGRREEQRLLREALCAEALKAAQGRAEALRLHLRWALGPALRVLEPRLGEAGSAGFAGAADQALARALSPSELLRAFTALCDDLAGRAEQPAKGELRQRLRRAQARLAERPEEVASLGELAREAGLSRHHFSRLFKRSAGVGFARARVQSRVDKARRLLEEGQLSIGAIALECGFKDQAYFSTVFKRVTGLNPRSCRNKKAK